MPAIANLFVYPIKRPYPLPPIKDSAEFVQYGKSYSMILSAKYYLKQPLKIGKNGVGEVFLYNYFVESSFNDGKMTYIMYKSEEEKN